MNKFIILIGVMSWSTTPLYADDLRHPEKQRNVAAKSAEPTLNSDQQKRAWDIVLKMQTQMEIIKTTRDPVERQRLLREHMREMDEGMKILSDLAKNEGDMTNNKMMKFRMDMMTTMMEQMMQREEVRDITSPQ